MSSAGLLTNALSFMTTPGFAIPWFLFGTGAAAWIIYDDRTANMALNPPLKAAWPIIVFFFSVIGIALYLVTSRPRGIGRYKDRMEKMRYFTEFSKPRWRKVIASVTHCVGGDGPGIMTAMVAARLMGFRFGKNFGLNMRSAISLAGSSFRSGPCAFRATDGRWPFGKVAEPSSSR